MRWMLYLVLLGLLILSSCAVVEKKKSLKKNISLITLQKC